MFKINEIQKAIEGIDNNPMGEKEVVYYVNATDEKGKSVKVEGQRERVNEQSILNRIAERNNQIARLEEENANDQLILNEW